MADSKKNNNKKETKTPEPTKTTNYEASRNALFILISLLIIVFLIGLALIINRGLNPDNTVNTTADNTGLINSDTNPPSNTTDNSATPATVPPVPPSPEPTPTPEPTPAPEPTPSSDGSVGTAASTESTDSGNSAVLPSGHTEEGYKRSLANQTEINEKNLWFPTNYNIGDIPADKGKYTVQYGDTLWWIAQGHYGDPFQWTKIENANFNLIGYLPDGEHSLIFPGQVFDLP